MKRYRSVLLGLFCLSLCTVASATISTTTFVHQYVASPGTGYAIGNPLVGDLIICSVSSGNSGSVTMSGSLNGAYSHLTQLIFDTNFSLDIFYILSSAAGSESVTITTSNTDNGINCEGYHDSAGGTWSIEVSSGMDGSKQAATASPRGGTLTTTGTSVWYMAFGDETAAWTGACTGSVPCPTGSFTNIQWDNTHIDANARWMGASAQTNLQPGWDATSAASTHWGIYTVAAKLTASASALGYITTTPGTGSISTRSGIGSISTR